MCARLIAVCNWVKIAASVRSSSRNTSRETLAKPIFCAWAAATVWALVRLSTKNLCRRCKAAISQAMAVGCAVMRLPMWLLMPLVYGTILNAAFRRFSSSSTGSSGCQANGPVAGSMGMCRMTILPARWASRANSVAWGVSGMIAAVTGPGRASTRRSRGRFCPRSSMIRLR
ncbi:hypothetical protein D3C73_1262820 [compost metagenome]